MFAVLVSVFVVKRTIAWIGRLVFLSSVLIRPMDGVVPPSIKLSQTSRRDAPPLEAASAEEMESTQISSGMEGGGGGVDEAFLESFLLREEGMRAPGAREEFAHLGRCSRRREQHNDI